MKFKKAMVKRSASIILSVCIAFSASVPYMTMADEVSSKMVIGADYNETNVPRKIVSGAGGSVTVEIEASKLGIESQGDLDKLSVKYYRADKNGNSKIPGGQMDEVKEYDVVESNQNYVTYIKDSIKFENNKIYVDIKLKANTSISNEQYYRVKFENKENPEKNVLTDYTVLKKGEVADNKDEVPDSPPGTDTPGTGSQENDYKISGVVFDSNVLPHNESTSTGFTIISTVDSPDKIEIEVYRDDTKVDNVGISNLAKSRLGIEGNIAFPENKTDTPEVYKVKFKIKDTLTVVEKQITVNPSKEKSDESNLIKNVLPMATSISPDGGTIELELETSESIQNQSISVADRLTKKVFDSIATGTGTKRKVRVTIPKENVEGVNNYELVFTGMGKETAVSSYQKAPIVTVKIDENSALSQRIDSVKVKIPTMSYEGGENSFTIKGSNLDTGKIEFKIERKENNVFVDVTDKVLKEGGLSGISTIMTGRMSIPKTDKDEEYRIKLTLPNKDEYEIYFYQKESGSSEKLGDFLPRMTYIRNKNEIVVRYFFDVSAVNKDTLKNGIKLKLYKNKEVKSLSNNDSVEVSGTDLVIKLGEEINGEELDSGAKVILNERVIKDAKNVENKANEYLIYNNISVLNDYKFIEGEVLEHNGGKVKIKLIGENLNSKNVKVKVQKNGKYDNEGTRPEIKDVKVTENNDSGKTMDIEFNLPENTSDLTETYVVLLSLDGGISYASDQKLELYDRTKKIIPAVLPNGKALNDKTLSFMRIHSYGTVGGNAEVPDTTYTETPIGQESKKTFVDLYGTNLEKSKTKVRLVDENGIIWYPVNESVHDSGDRVIMINLDGTGIEGNGNNQKLEVILPRGYSGDMTFTYQVAIDGVNFDEKTVVRARIIDDKEGIKPTFAEKIRTANVKYQTADGEDVAASRDIKVMKQLPLRITEIRPLEIDGYKYVGIKGYKKDMSKIERLAELEKLEKEGKLTDEQKKEMDTLKIDIRLREREELNEPLGERNEVVFLYEKVDDKKTEGENNSNSGNNNANNNTNNTDSKPDLGASNNSGGSSNSGSSAGSSNSSSTGIPKIALNDEAKKEKNKTVERIYGDDRYDTSYNIAKRAVKSANRVIVVSGENFADALTSAPLAFSKDSVILLSSDGNVKKLKEEINRLNPREVIISGGSNSVSDAVENAIKGDSKAIRISGNDRYKTAAKNAEKAIIENGNKKKVIIVDGRNYPDAISIAPYAAKNGFPILLANGNKLSDEQMSVIKKYGIDEAIIIGGQNSIGSSIDGLFNKSTRVAGKDRYETSRLVAKKYFGDARKIVIASGRNFADALSVSYYAAQTNSPVVLTDGMKNDDNLLKLLKDFNFEELVTVGGVNSIKESILSNIK